MNVPTMSTMPAIDASPGRLNRSEPEQHPAQLDVSGLAAYGFEVMVNRLRQASDTNKIHPSAATSPELMFEPPPSGETNRRAADRASDATSAATSANADVRRQALDARPAVAAPRTLAAPHAGGGFERAGANGPGFSEVETAARGVADPAPPGQSSDAIDTASASASNTRGATFSTLMPAAPSPAAMVAHARADVATTMTGVTPAYSVSVTGADANSPARQIGEFLAAARPGTVDSARGTHAPASALESAGSPGTSRDAPASRAAGMLREGEFVRQPADAKSTAESQPFQQLVRAIRVYGADGVSSARLHLMPPELGRLRVDVRVIGDQVEILVRTEHEAAREQVALRAESLAAALQEQGLHVARFEVHARTPMPSAQDQASPSDAFAAPPEQDSNGAWWDRYDGWRGFEPGADFEYRNPLPDFSEDRYSTEWRGYSFWRADVRTGARLDVLA